MEKRLLTYGRQSSFSLPTAFPLLHAKKGLVILVLVTRCNLPHSLHFLTHTRCFISIVLDVFVLMKFRWQSRR